MGEFQQTVKEEIRQNLPKELHKTEEKKTKPKQKISPKSFHEMSTPQYQNLIKTV